MVVLRKMSFPIVALVPRNCGNVLVRCGACDFLPAEPPLLELHDFNSDSCLQPHPLRLVGSL
jgi:hypothetical protein